MVRFILRFYALVGLALLLAGCGGSSQNDPLSLYDSTTLIVKGVRYERPSGIYECGSLPVEAICTPADPRPSYEARVILVGLNSADEKEVTNALLAYGLSVRDRLDLRAVGDLPALTYLTVAVPVFFEEQWAEAFRKESLTFGAWTNNFGYLT
ncbi:hypothetical protein KTQ42_08290|uniref:hypothetical protein n=1 Tax=Noviherbaspirillum sp. L7-7A TaxID=2850560 RepID=UPI001C2CAD75|nr:hypothetical protein [Noviherbaspirillum sp. L7-7A]MBV0879300.1 hypothetical protein [Noviherbaspirillum sp. L7-7A]